MSTTTIRSDDTHGARTTGDPVGADAEPTVAAAATLVEEDLLVEDVSIDGMCGVY